MNIRRWGLAVGCGLVVSVVACSDDRSTVADRVSDDGSTRVVALDNSFRATNQEVSPGTDVVFVNLGRNVHDIVPAEGSSDWGVTQEQFGPGGSYRIRFTEPGVYPYYCSIHGNENVGMVGQIEVLP